MGLKRTTGKAIAVNPRKNRTPALETERVKSTELRLGMDKLTSVVMPRSSKIVSKVRGTSPTEKFRPERRLWLTCA